MILQVTSPKHTTIQPGVHLVEIVNGEYNAKTRFVILKVKDENALLHSLYFDLNRIDWLFNKLCKAFDMDWENEPVYIKSTTPRKKLKGQKMWVCIREYVQFHDDGEIIAQHCEPFAFYDYSRTQTMPALHKSLFLKELQIPSEKTLTQMPLPKQL